MTRIYYNTVENTTTMLIATSAAGSELITKLESMRHNGLVSFDNIDGENRGRFKTLVIDASCINKIEEVINSDPRYDCSACSADTIEIAAKWEEFEENPMWDEVLWDETEWGGSIEPRKR
ncbi:hypothetical protein LCGC14_1059990 [marine sediment metagenome]|uniref:Uncharacterized protein n=1 Tax=marine sediment metagenome TaxID=412755 RepID=A0A0F9MQZ0_9ZZZZ